MTSKPDIPPLQETLHKLPERPGVYQFINSQGEILYIGKAKNLRKRVASYFTRTDLPSYKHEVLVKKVQEIRYIVVDDEPDALLLENNLIKEYKPRYNVLLKDDKTFPWVVITRERFPRVMLTRNYAQDGSEYFGPYTSAVWVRSLLDLIRQEYRLRTCKLNLSQENIDKKKFRRCLEYDLGNCLAPCEGLQAEADYMEAIGQIRDLLKGNYQQVIRQLRDLMQQHAAGYRFEQAEIVRLKIEALEKFKVRSTVVNPRIDHVDVYGVIDEPQAAYVNFMKIVHGAVVQSHNVEVVKRISEDREDILSYVIFNLRERFQSKAPEILVPFLPASRPDSIRFTIPRKGDKKKLLELSERNARLYQKDRQLAREAQERPEKRNSVLEALKKDLRLKSEPKRIECFDNSNLQGSNPVASCVVFVGGKPKKSEYRHFNIRSVSGPNDFASMEEIIFRRYRRVLEEKTELPDLIVVDGGKGQLTAAITSLEKLGLRQKIAVVGIAKRLEEIYIPGDPVPLYIDKHSPSLRLIQQVRNEAHRFGIRFHRRKREQSLLISELDTIPGVGPATRDKLFRKIRDMEQLSRMNVEDIAAVAGMRAAKLIYNYFHEQGRENQGAAAPDGL